MLCRWSSMLRMALPVHAGDAELGVCSGGSSAGLIQYRGRGEGRGCGWTAALAHSPARSPSPMASSCSGCLYSRCHDRRGGGTSRVQAQPYMHTHAPVVIVCGGRSSESSSSPSPTAPSSAPPSSPGPPCCCGALLPWSARRPPAAAPKSPASPSSSPATPAAAVLRCCCCCSQLLVGLPLPLPLLLPPPPLHLPPPLLCGWSDASKVVPV